MIVKLKRHGCQRANPWRKLRHLVVTSPSPEMERLAARQPARSGESDRKVRFSDRNIIIVSRSIGAVSESASAASDETESPSSTIVVPTPPVVQPVGRNSKAKLVILDERGAGRAQLYRDALRQGRKSWGASFAAEFWFYICNTHEILSLFLSHPKHPITVPQRAVMLLVTSTIALGLT